MRIWKILIAFAFPYFILGCCNCVEPILRDYSNCNLQLENIDHAGADLVLSQSDTLLKEAYGIHLIIERQEGFCMKSSAVFTSAYATSCGCPSNFQYLPNDSILGLEIRTLNYFDTSHQAGDLINEYFKRFERGEYEDLDNYLENLNGIAGYQEDKPIDNFEFDVLLMTPPTQDGLYSFEVKLLLNNNRTLTSTTKPIYLK